MLKLPSTILLAFATAASSAFTIPSSPSSSTHAQLKSSLYATVEGTRLVAPSDIPVDDVPALFDKYVQKTYG